MSVGSFILHGLAWFGFALVCLVLVLFFLAYRRENFPHEQG